MSAVIKANHYCDIFGMDPISVGSTIAAAMELYEKGLIPEEDLQGKNRYSGVLGGAQRRGGRHGITSPECYFYPAWDCENLPA